MATAEFSGMASLEKGKPFEPWTYTPEPLRATDIEIRVTHNGLCHTDMHMRDNDWGITTFPLIAGHEVVGVIEQVGSEVPNLKVGDRVAYGWIRDACKTCANCLKGEENVCKTGYSGLILGHHGGFQGRLRAPCYMAIKLPDALDSVDAAPLMCAGVTVFSPLRMYVKEPGMSVGVLGIGGLGHLALQMARAMGADVTAFSTSPGKEAEARGFGANHFVAYDPNAAPGAGYGVPPERRVKVLINCSPALPPEGDFRNMMSLLEVDGTLVLCGAPPSALGKVALLDVIFQQKRLVGSIVGGRVVINAMFEFCAANNIKPKTQTMKLSQLNEACAIVAANKARYRIVLLED